MSATSASSTTSTVTVLKYNDFNNGNNDATDNLVRKTESAAATTGTTTTLTSTPDSCYCLVGSRNLDNSSSKKSTTTTTSSSSSTANNKFSNSYSLSNFKQDNFTNNQQNIIQIKSSLVCYSSTTSEEESFDCSPIPSTLLLLKQVNDFVEFLTRFSLSQYSSSTYQLLRASELSNSSCVCLREQSKLPCDTSSFLTTLHC
ncbi:unnamed protein product [Orchesella dallaii]|uniref:Uncharacterized protein n=1 Tax=Orchesella dallaii TaxID=48710 RepID=A0ABP1S4S2_9HEXA